MRDLYHVQPGKDCLQNCLIWVSAYEQYLKYRKYEALRFTMSFSDVIADHFKKEHYHNSYGYD